MTSDAASERDTEPPAEDEACPFRVDDHRVVTEDHNVIAVCHNRYTAAVVAIALHRMGFSPKDFEFPKWDGSQGN